MKIQDRFVRPMLPRTSNAAGGMFPYGIREIVRSIFSCVLVMSAGRRTEVHMSIAGRR